jgi:hypothetical protein
MYKVITILKSHMDIYTLHLLCALSALMLLFSV